ncbi:MAG: hypothetical protein E7611_04315 [Ruminococcaceae bacterium]|nr:hypothetical protein [Oscillospiraceae bacterium]
MKNELEKRNGGDILYEPVDPLFSDAPIRRRRIWMRMAALGIFVSLMLSVWVLVAWKKSTPQNDGEITPGVTEAEPEQTEGAVIEDEDETHLTEAETESQSFSTDESERAEESEVETTGEVSREIIEADLSQIDRGELYVNNYSGEELDIVGLSDRGFTDTVQKGNSAPLVLIIHSHTSEDYRDGGSGYKGPLSVVSVGDAFSARLNALGISAVHCSAIHDSVRENAYENARETIEMMLEVYPSIKYVIDIHRMELESAGRDVKTVSGCSDGAAQIRLSVGAPSVDANAAADVSLALVLRKSLNKGEARVCMPIAITQSLPNCNLSKYYISVDVGARANTVEEAMAAGERLAFALYDVLIK